MGEADVIAAVRLLHPEFSEADARRAWRRGARIDVNWAAVERIASAVAAKDAELAQLREASNYLHKWVERGLFDPAVSAREALSVIARMPSAPWANDRWDVDHKPYASAFYQRFPAASATPE